MDGCEQTLYDGIPFIEYLEKWKSIAKIQVTQVTYEGYFETIANHLIPYFKKWKLTIQEITSDTIQAYYSNRLENGRLDGTEGLSATSIRQHHAVLRQVFSKSVNDRLIKNNPIDGVALPKLTNYQANFYSMEEVQLFLDQCDDDRPIKLIVLLTTYYGLRRSEVMGLRWQSVDFENGVLRIEHTAMQRKTLVYKDSTKNQSSLRSYLLFGAVKEKLLQLKKSSKKIENYLKVSISILIMFSPM